MLLPAVIGHHERYDGKGYPRRIAGEDIPLTARILCVADSFDAMTSIRCYKESPSL
jgi:diguanylate cyclase with GAF sensor